jgi:Glycosyltransferase
MKVIHVISSISDVFGGPSRSSQGLVAALQGCGVEAWLVVFNRNDKPWIDGVVHFKCIESGSFEQRKKSFGRVVDEIEPDVIHVHGLWLFVNHIACVVARKKGIPYIIAPRGMLEPWSLEQKKWKKKTAMFLYQRYDLKKAAALHATAQAEAEQFKRLEITHKIIVSPNGLTLPKQIPRRTCKADAKKNILFLSRIHPKKGLLVLIEAVARLKQLSLFHGWHIEYAGPDYEGHLEEVKDRIKALNLQDEFSYLGILDDQSKWDAYSCANLFVLSTYSENFGIVIPEALYARIPVITTKGTPWEELETERCGKWIDIGVEPLAKALQEVMSLTDEKRQMMGENGRRLVDAKYTWPAIAEQMISAYKGILHDSERPTCVGRDMHADN